MNSNKKPLAPRQAGLLFLAFGIICFILVPLMPTPVFFNSYEWPSNGGSAALAMGILTFVAIVCMVIAMLYFRMASEEEKANPSNIYTSTSFTSGNNLETELRKLDDMKARGVIDEAEYKKLRENLISRS
jgi:uncharacterized membrane protein